jgi:hypothetical protein
MIAIGNTVLKLPASPFSTTHDFFVEHFSFAFANCSSATALLLRK